MNDLLRDFLARSVDARGRRLIRILMRVFIDTNPWAYPLDQREPINPRCPSAGDP